MRQERRRTLVFMYIVYCTRMYNTSTLCQRLIKSQCVLLETNRSNDNMCKTRTEPRSLLSLLLVSLSSSFFGIVGGGGSVMCASGTRLPGALTSNATGCSCSAPAPPVAGAPTSMHEKEFCLSSINRLTSKSSVFSVQCSMFIVQCSDVSSLQT